MPIDLEVDVKIGWGAPDPWPCLPELRYDEDRAASVSSEKRRNLRSKTQRVTALRVARRYGVPPGRVFDAWLNPAVARLWLFATASRPLDHVEIDGQVNGSFCFVDRRNGGDMTEYTGEYVEIVPREHAKHMEGRWVGVLYGLGATLDSTSTLFHDYQE